MILFVYHKHMLKSGTQLFGIMFQISDRLDWY